LQKLAEDFEEASNELMIADEEQVRVLLAGSALHCSLVTGHACRQEVVRAGRLSEVMQSQRLHYPQSHGFH
jgi:hypothetical protein